ncbi:MAG: metalloregulator ArsR/SmtB family transcription factor [Desulfobacterales bacterium]|jgi:DNA-binding transcriptional ArsR family regulator
MREFMTITKALADENRVRILMALRGRELCVCQIIDLIALAPSTVSKHLSLLKQARLVEGRKAGRWMYYRLADGSAPGMVSAALAWVAGALNEDDRMAADQEHLTRMEAVDPEMICA